MLSIEAPDALIAVIIFEVADVEFVVRTPELFVSERVVLIASLDGIPVETPKRIFDCQRFFDLIVLDVR